MNKWQNSRSEFHKLTSVGYKYHKIDRNVQFLNLYEKYLFTSYPTATPELIRANQVKEVITYKFSSYSVGLTVIQTWRNEVSKSHVYSNHTDIYVLQAPLGIFVSYLIKSVIK